MNGAQPKSAGLFPILVRRLRSSVPPADIHQITGLLQELARKSSSKGDRAVFEELLAKTQPILDYVGQQPAIEAASKAIEAHRADFDKLVEDQKAYLERTQALFAEERFVPLRFTADDVQRAFDKVGHPTPGSSDDSLSRPCAKPSCTWRTRNGGVSRR